MRCPLLGDLAPQPPWHKDILDDLELPGAKAHRLVGLVSAAVYLSDTVEWPATEEVAHGYAGCVAPVYRPGVDEENPRVRAAHVEALHL